MPPQDSKHYHVPFGNDANFVNHLGVEDIKMQPIPELPPRHAVFLQHLACLARHQSAFTSMCGTVTEERGALEPPPEGGARTKLYSTENSSSANRILRPIQKTLDQIPDTNKGFHIYLQGLRMGAGQHFDNLRCSCPIWHVLNFKVMPRV